MKKEEEKITVFDLNIIYPCIQITGPKHFNWPVWFLLIISRFSFLLHHVTQRRWFSRWILLRLLCCIISYRWTIHVSGVHSGPNKDRLPKEAVFRRCETSHGLGPCRSLPLHADKQASIYRLQTLGIHHCCFLQMHILAAPCSTRLCFTYINVLNKYFFLYNRN